MTVEAQIILLRHLTYEIPQRKARRNGKLENETKNGKQHNSMATCVSLRKKSSMRNIYTKFQLPSVCYSFKNSHKNQKCRGKCSGRHLT